MDSVRKIVCRIYFSSKGSARPVQARKEKAVYPPQRAIMTQKKESTGNVWDMSKKQIIRK